MSRRKRRTGLRGGTIHFDRMTVTGTEDVMMAAVLARRRHRDPQCSA